MTAAEFEIPEPNALLRVFGNQLRTLREARGMSRDVLGGKTGFSASTIGAFERGDRIADAKAAKALDVALEANGVLAVAGEDLEQEQYPRKFAPFFRLEAEALSMSSYSTHVIHGLLQTEDYARALFRAWVPHWTDEDVERLTEERLARQSLFSRHPLPVLCFILEESILLRRTGGRDVMKDQLRHLLEIAQLRHVQIWVVPLDCEEIVGSSGAMTLLETPDYRMLGYAESHLLKDRVLDSEKEHVSEWMHRYESIRGQALRPADSARVIERHMEAL